MSVEGMVFDLAGIIVDGNSREFYDELRRKYGSNIQYQLRKDLYHKASGGDISYNQFIGAIAPEISIPSIELESKLADVVSSRARIIQGAYELLLQVQKLGLRSVILANSIAVWVNLIWRKLQLKMFVSRILVSSMMHVRKPNARAFLRAANAIGSAPQESVYVGDEDEDIRGAGSIEMKTVLLPEEDRISEYCDYRIWCLRKMLYLPIFPKKKPLVFGQLLLPDFDQLSNCPIQVVFWLKPKQFLGLGHI